MTCRALAAQVPGLGPKGLQEQRDLEEEAHLEEHLLPASPWSVVLPEWSCGAEHLEPWQSPGSLAPEVQEGP